MTFAGRDAGEIEALVTDRYLDALLGGSVELLPERMGARAANDATGGAGPGPTLDAAIRAASRRLADDLPRFHPSFRFEERLAVRLAEAAAAMRLPLAAGAERQVAQLPPPADIDPLAIADDGETGPLSDALSRPALVRGAVAASAISLAGAAWYAWRHRPPTSPMARAIRAAHGPMAGRSHLGRAGRA